MNPSCTWDAWQDSQLMKNEHSGPDTTFSKVLTLDNK